MADVFLGSVYATLELRNVEGFQRQLGAASSAGTDFKNTMLGVFAGNLLTQGFNVAGQAIVGFARDAVTGAADLQSSMGLLQAVTGATTSQMKQFSDQAIALGNDITLPAVSAADASDAMIELGKAGLSVTDIMSASKGVLQAAAAGNLAVADSAKIVSGALMTFGLEGGQATKVADLLAAAANSSSLELGDVGLALNQAGAQAAIAGLSLSETVGIIAQMSNKGISAQQAGTSLSYMLKSLLSPTDKAAEVMGNLGLKMFDNEGKFIGARAAIEQLNAKTKDLTQEQKAQALSTIFGAEALKAANVVMQDGVAGFDKMQTAVNKTGAANDLAKSRQVGFNGAVAALQNTLETTAIQIGTALLPGLTAFVNFLGGNLQPILIGVAGGIVGLGIAAIVASGGFFALAAGVWAAISPLLPFVAAGVALALILKAIWDNTTILQTAFAVIKDTITSVWNAVQLLVTGDFKGGIFGLEEDSGFVNVLLTIRETAIKVWEFLSGQFASIWDSLSRIFTQVGNALKPIIDAMVKFYQEHAAQFAEAFKIIGIVVAALTFGPLAIAIAAVIAVIVVLAKILEFVANNFETIKNVVLTVLAVALAPLLLMIGLVVGVIWTIVQVVQHWGDMMNWLGGVISSIAGAITGFFTGIGTAVANAFNGVVGAVTGVFNTVAGVISTAFTFIGGILMGIWTTVLKPVFDGIMFVVTAVGQVFWTIFSGIAEIVFTVVSTIVQIIGVVLFGIVMFIWNNILLPIGQFFVTAWFGLVSIVSNALTAVWNVISAVWSAIWGFLQPIIQAIVDFVVERWNNLVTNITNAVNLVWGIIQSVWSAISGFIQPIVAAIVSFVTERWNNLVNNVTNAVNTVRNVISSVWNAISSTISNIVGGIVNTVSSNFNNVVGAVRDGITNAYNAVTGFVGRFLDAGRDVINGIVRGISGGKDAVVGKIKDICAGALDSVKSFFGIKSPSRVMAKMFGYVMQGAELGISRNAGSLLDTFNAATSLLPSAMDIPVSLSGRAYGASASSVLGGVSSTTSNTTSTVSMGDVTINTKSDDSRFMSIITRNSELAEIAIVGAGA